MQFFKGDDAELKFYGIGKPVTDAIALQRQTMLEEVFEAYELGDLIIELGLAPLSNAIKPEVFRTSFQHIFESFIGAGTFESYMIVFRAIFGDDVDVEFTVPGPGQLNIEIHATTLEIVDFIARRIQDNQYVFDEIVTQDGDNIAFQSFKGLESQYEVEQMLFEMVPGGIFTQVTLTIGG